MKKQPKRNIGLTWKSITELILRTLPEIVKALGEVIKIINENAL